MSQTDQAPRDTPRRIKSFVKREGRLTSGQEKNLAALWPRYGLNKPDTPLDWAGVFGRDAHRQRSWLANPRPSGSKPERRVRKSK